MESWIYWVLGSAVLIAIANIVRKHVLNHEHAMEQLAAEAPFKLLVIIFLVPFVTMPTGTEMLLIALNAGFLYLAMLYRNKSYRHMPISSVAPLNNLSPLILLVLAVLILKEQIAGLQFLGILFIIIGGYALNLKNSNPFSPLKGIKNHESTRSIILLLVFISIVAMMNRWMLNDVGIDIIGYLFWMTFMVEIFSLIMHFELYHFSGVKTDIKKGWKWLLLISVLSVLDILVFFKGIKFPAALIALAIPLRRTSTLIEVILGGKIFHEEGILRKTIGTLIMLGGVLLIV